MKTILSISAAMLLTLVASGTPPAPAQAPVTYAGYWASSNATPGHPSPTLTFYTPVLPAGYGCTSVTVRLYDRGWTRSFDVSEVGGQAPGIVTFSAPVSLFCTMLVAADGTVCQVARTQLVPFPVFVPPGGVYQHATPWDQSTNTQQIPIPPPVETTVSVPAGFCETATPDPVFVNACRWQVVFDASMVDTAYASGTLRTRQTLWAGGTYDITFNR